MLLLLAGARAVKGQAAPDSATTIEFIGLKRWTVEMIRDTMAVKAPGLPLGRCAEVLREIGFPSASSAEFDRAGSRHIVVTLVEPADSARVRPRPEPADSAPDVPEWREAAAVFRTRNFAFQAAVSAFGSHRRGDAAAERAVLAARRGDSVAVRRVWAFLDAHRRPADFERAAWILGTDGNAANMAISAAILGSFADRPLAWWTLMDALRSPRAPVATTAAQVLRALGPTARPVDWAPATPSIRAMLAGTNVFVLSETLQVLRDTRVSPALAAALLSDGNGELVLGYLGAREPFLRSVAHGFLVQLAGRDVGGSDRAAWARWMASLR
jgi:hypothetical protein